MAMQQEESYRNMFSDFPDYGVVESVGVLVHYEGPLGVFDYDNTEFEVYDGDDFSCLRYIGKELSDGSKIKIPEGIVDCNRMFKHCEHLKQPPVIPYGVKNCEQMFFGCKSLEQPPVIPEGATDCDAMFYRCESLQQLPKLPDSVENSFDIFYGCPFQRNIVEWGTYRFTINEQRELLKGKEVTLSNYTTRGGEHLDVKGRFASYIDKNGDRRFGFVPSNNERTTQRRLPDTPSEKRQLSVDNKTF